MENEGFQLQNVAKTVELAVSSSKMLQIARKTGRKNSLKKGKQIFPKTILDPYNDIVSSCPVLFQNNFCLFCVPLNRRLGIWSCSSFDTSSGFSVCKWGNHGKPPTTCRCKRSASLVQLPWPASGDAKVIDEV